MNIQPAQLAIGIFFGIMVSFIAWKAKSLSTGGAFSAAILGAIVFGVGGLSWAVLLLGFFISSSGLSRLLARRKAALNEKFSKGSRRDQWQVLANGGVAGIMVLFHLGYPSAIWPWLAYAGALAAVNADTWATELGVLSSTPPRMIHTGKKVERGTSGAITPGGTLAAFSGALFIALLAVPFWRLFTPTASIFTIFCYTLLVSLSGLAGSLVDSLLGATVQSIYYCPTCGKETERSPIHTCGTETRRIRGWEWMDNDWVNIACSVGGALLTVLTGWLI